MGNLSETNYKLRIEKLEGQNSLLIEKIKEFHKFLNRFYKRDEIPLNEFNFEFKEELNK